MPRGAGRASVVAKPCCKSSSGPRATLPHRDHRRRGDQRVAGRSALTYRAGRIEARPVSKRSRKAGSKPQSDGVRANADAKPEASTMSAAIVGYGGRPMLHRGDAPAIRLQNQSASRACAPWVRSGRGCNRAARRATRKQPVRGLSPEMPHSADGMRPLTQVTAEPTEDQPRGDAGRSARTRPAGPPLEVPRVAVDRERAVGIRRAHGELHRGRLAGDDRPLRAQACHRRRVDAAAPLGIEHLAARGRRALARRMMAAPSGMPATDRDRHPAVNRVACARASEESSKRATSAERRVVRIRCARAATS